MEMMSLRRSLGGDELGVAVLLSGRLALLLLLLVGIVPRAPVVVLGEDLLVDLGQHALLEESEEIPSGIERLENGTAAVLALLQEIGLELLEEDQEVLVISGEGILTDDSLHGQRVFTRGVEGVHLREDGWMIVTGELMAVLFDTDGRLHQTRQRGEHIDGRVDLPVVQGVVNEDLALGDVAGEIGDRMGDIGVGHSQDGQLGDGTIGTTDTTGSLVDGGEIGVHVTWVTTTAWHFFSGGRDLTKSVGVGGHISENGEHMHLLSVGQVLGSGQGETRRDDSLNGGIVGQVHEEHDTVHGAVHLEIGLEETSSLHIDTHSGEDEGEVLLRMIMHILMLDQGGLTTNLGTDGVMGETGGREEGNLLATGNGVHDIDGGDTGLDHLLRVVTLERINWLAL